MRYAIIASSSISLAAAQGIACGNVISGILYNPCPGQSGDSGATATVTGSAPGITPGGRISIGASGGGNGVVVVDGTTLTGSAAASARESIDGLVSSRLSQALGPISQDFGDKTMPMGASNAAGQGPSMTGPSSTSSGDAAHATAVVGMGAVILGGAAAFLL